MPGWWNSTGRACAVLRVWGLDPGVVHVESEAVQARGPGVAEVRQPEGVFYAGEQAVVVVRGGGPGAALGERRENQRADPAAAQPGNARQRRIRPGTLTAARAGIGLRAVRFVEGDDQDAVLLERRGGRDGRDPLLEPLVGAFEAAIASLKSGQPVAVRSTSG